VIAVALTLLALLFARKIDFPAALGSNFVVAQCIGFSIHVLFRVGLAVFGAERLERFTLRQRGLFYAGIPILGVFLGYAIGGSVLGIDLHHVVVESPRVVSQILFFSLMLSAFWYRFAANKARLARAEADAIVNARGRSSPTNNCSTPGCARCRRRSSRISCSTRWPTSPA
jgi:hypothetical protein